MEKTIIYFLNPQTKLWERSGFNEETDLIEAIFTHFDIDEKSFMAENENSITIGPKRRKQRESERSKIFFVKFDTLIYAVHNRQLYMATTQKNMDAMLKKEQGDKMLSKKKRRKQNEKNTNDGNNDKR